MNKERLLTLLKREDEGQDAQPERDESTHADTDDDGISRCDVCQCTLAESDFAEGRVHVDEAHADVYCMACWSTQSNATEPTLTPEQRADGSNDIDEGCTVRMVPPGVVASDYIDGWYAEQREQQPASTTQPR